MSQFIPLSVPNIHGNELNYITNAITSEWVSTAGSYINEFEQAMANYVKVPNAVACQSGTAGLHLALLSLGIERGDEVIVPTLTFIAAVNPIKYVGAEPVFMDCDDSLTMDPIKLQEFLETKCTLKNGVLYNKTSNRIIKAILVVHVFGNIANMEKIMKLANKYQLKVIEDATEALGSYYVSGTFAGSYAGTIGDIGVYSFNGNKIITTGGGGMIVSHNESLLARCKYLSTQAKDDLLYFVHNEIGYNYRMTNLQAALGLGQLEQLETFIETKEENYKEYLRHDIPLLPFSEKVRPNYWFYSYFTKDRDALLMYLNEQQIQTRPIWTLIHTLKPYATAEAYQIQTATHYFDHILNLPCSSNLTKEQVKRVADAIHQYHAGGKIPNGYYSNNDR